jgi:hypothetical protein
MLRVIQTAVLAVSGVIPSLLLAWNAPTHMVSGAIAYRLLQRESPATVEKLFALLERHPRYASRWRDDIERAPASHRTEMLFMLAAWWAEDIRRRDREYDRPQWLHRLSV